GTRANGRSSGRGTTDGVESGGREHGRLIARYDPRASGGVRGHAAGGRTFALVGFGATSPERPRAGAFSFLHDGGGSGGRVARIEADCSGRGGVCAAKVAGSGAALAGRPVHHPAIFT